MDAWARDADQPSELTTWQFDQVLRALRGRSLKFVISVKDPVSWVNSYFRYAKTKYEYRRSGKRFEFTLDFTAKALDSWRERMASYADFVAENPTLCLVVQHESLLQSPRAVLERFENQFNLSASKEPELFLQGYAKRGTEEEQGRALINPKMSLDRAYHLEGRWVDDVPREVLEYAIDFRDRVFNRQPRIRGLLNVESLGVHLAKAALLS